jgi:hypothetical protein
MEHIGNNNQKIQHPRPTPKMRKTWNPWVHINSTHWVQELQLNIYLFIYYNGLLSHNLDNPRSG